MNVLAGLQAITVLTLPIGVMAVLFGVTLLCSALGFRRVVYFVSIGYAFSIVAMAVLAPLLFATNLTVASVAQNLLLLAWGVRLGWFLVRRELHPSYRNELASVQERGAGITPARKVIIWVGVALLYVIMYAPALFHLAPAHAPAALAATVTQVLGLALMAGGLLMEGVADRQKSAFKAAHPQAFSDVGLYRWVRCPNYLGEITFWLGNWVVAMAFYTSVVQWIVASVGFACILLIMMGSTKRLERQQERRYGAQAAYQHYVRTVPVLIPFVPVYSLKDVRVFIE